MRISNFIIGFAIISLFVVVISIYYSGLTEKFNSDGYDETQVLIYNKTAELSQTASDINTTLTTVQQGNAIDVVGGLLSSGYTVLKSTWQSFDMYTEVTAEAANQARLGKATNIFVNTALIIGFLLFMFAIIAVLTGRDKV